MKKQTIKLIFILISTFFIFNISYGYNLPSYDFDSSAVSGQYLKMEKLIDSNFGAKIGNLTSSNKVLFDTRINEIKDLFIKLDNNVTSKNKIEVGYTFTDIKNRIKDLILFLKNIKLNTQDSNINLNEFAKDTNHGYLTYYADFFEGRGTSNGDKFSHVNFSAAKCNIPLDTMLQILIGGKSLLVKANDRPDCARYPYVVDLTRTAYNYLYDKNQGKQKAEFIILGKIYDDYYKLFVPNNFFSNSNIVLQGNLPNSYLFNESIHINGIINEQDREVILDITTPSGKNISLKKDVEKYFSFSYPLEEAGVYYIGFNGSPKFKIYSLDDSSFAGKKFISQDIPKLDSVKIIKDPLGKGVNGYRIVLKGNNYNIAQIKIGAKTYFFSGVGDIIIPEYIILENSSISSFNLNIKSSKTITGFSHDFYTELVTIFSGNVGISQ